MVKGGIFWTRIVAAIFLCAGLCACKTAKSNNVELQDTVILAHSNSPFSINSEKTFYQLIIKPSGSLVPAPGKKIWLRLEGTKVERFPDGVIEIYISNKTRAINTLDSKSPDFVNVLDLYSLTADTPPRTIEVDLTPTLGKLTKTRESSSPITLTVLFRGNGLPGNGESKNAGRVSFQGFRIIE